MIHNCEMCGATANLVGNQIICPECGHITETTYIRKTLLDEDTPEEIRIIDNLLIEIDDFFLERKVPFNIEIKALIHTLINALHVWYNMSLKTAEEQGLKEKDREETIEAICISQYTQTILVILQRMDIDMAEKIADEIQRIIVKYKEDHPEG